MVASDRRSIWTLVPGGKPAGAAAHINLDLNFPRVEQRIALPYAKISWVLYDVNQRIRIKMAGIGTFLLVGQRLLPLYEGLLTHSVGTISEQDPAEEDGLAPFVERILVKLDEDKPPKKKKGGGDAAETET